MAAHLRKRPKNRRGSQRTYLAQIILEEPGCNLGLRATAYLEHLQSHNFSQETVRTRTHDLRRFCHWCVDHGVYRAADVDKSLLERYQRQLHRYRKDNGEPLSFTTQTQRLISVRELFRWLCRQRHLPFNPASELELPRKPVRLPEEPMTIEEVESVLQQPDVADALGLRDRAMLEVLYSAGLRRTELVHLRVDDLNVSRGTLQVRQGKGHKDRVVPVGARALHWLERYLGRAREQLLLDPENRVLFLSAYGEAFHPVAVSARVKKYMKQAGVKRKGSCHQFRHSCATHMLEGGADIRYIQHMLGHDDLRSTEIYTRVSIQKLQQVHEETHPGAQLKRSAD